ncbi:MAG: four helix bundle protein [Patescibacteria group bacterium]
MGEIESEKIKNKNDLKNRVYRYALDIIQFIDGLDRRDMGTQIMGKQLLRSGTSVGANIVEAQAGSSRKDFTNFLSYSLKSANESRFWLELFRDSKKAKVEEVTPLLKETNELANILGSSIITLKRGK